MDQSEEEIRGLSSPRVTAQTGPQARPFSSGDAEASFASLESGDLFARLGDHAQALQTYLALWAAPDAHGDLALAHRIAHCQDRLGRHPEAIHLLAPLLAQTPPVETPGVDGRLDLSQCHLELGKAYLAAGRLSEAEAEGQLALATLGDARGQAFGFAHNLLTALFSRRGDVEQARKHCRTALESFRSQGDVHNLAMCYTNLGYLYKVRCEWNRALEHYQAAYYLRATEGEYQTQAVSLQNIGLVLLRVGRFEEAREYLEKALALTSASSDPIRLLRSRLALARLARESWELGTAHEHLAECRRALPPPLPEREACLLLLEEAHLARMERRFEEAKSAAAGLRERAERLAAHGDLMIETLLLEGTLALEQRRWPEAGDAYVRAQGLAREDQDRYQENRAFFGQMEVASRIGQQEEADRLFRVLEDRHEHGGELPALARIYLSRGQLEQQVRREPEQALVYYTKARDLWRRMGRERLADMCELRLVDTLLDLRRQPEAAALLRDVRERLGGEEFLPHLGNAFAVLEERIRGSAEASSPAQVDGEQAFHRLEEVLAAGQSPGETLRGILLVIAEALAADGAVLGRMDGEGLEVLCTISMGRLQGKRSLSPSLLGIADPKRADLMDASDLGGDGGRSGALCLPVSLGGRDHLLYLERRDPRRSAYGRTDLDYVKVLMAEVARSYRARSGAESAAEIGELSRGIWLADVVTQNPLMLSILELIRKVAPSDLTVLLQGETGTGKKLLAQAIHRTSARGHSPFVTVDCAALPDNLLESELFGHRKGAFTGAVADRVGLLEEANGGSIFLDEIDKAGLSVQRRFLHMLDSGEVRPVGATSYRRLDVRVVCATSCPDIRREVAAGNFLKDLYYRLNDISILVPPLRERPEDVPLLAEWFIERYAGLIGREVGGVSPAFHAILAAHVWPGNVRELEKAIRRAVTLLDGGGVLVPDLLPAPVLESAQGMDPQMAGTLREKVENFERGLILDVLDRNGWNKSRAALALGLSRRGLKNKIQRYRLDRRRTRHP